MLVQNGNQNSLSYNFPYSRFVRVGIFKNPRLGNITFIMIQVNKKFPQITVEEIELANQEYEGLIDIVTCSLPDSLLQPLLQRLHLEKVQRQSGEQFTAKQFLFNCDLALRSVVAKEALQWRKGNVTQVIK